VMRMMRTMMMMLKMMMMILMMILMMMIHTSEGKTNEGEKVMKSCSIVMRERWRANAHASMYAQGEVRDFALDGSRQCAFATTSGRARAIDGFTGETLDVTFSGARFAMSSRAGVARGDKGAVVVVGLRGEAEAFDWLSDGGARIAREIPRLAIARRAFEVVERRGDGQEEVRARRAPSSRRRLMSSEEASEENEASMDDLAARDGDGDESGGRNYLRANAHEGGDDEEHYALDVRVLCSPTSGDVDGDGAVEIVVAVSYYYEASSQYVATGVVILDGATLAVKHAFELDRVKTLYSTASTKAFASPTLADVDGDGALDIVVGTTAGNVHVISSADGSPLRGWPRKVASIDAAVVVVDIDADGDVDVIACDGRGDVTAFTASGGELWVRHLDSKISVAASVGDIDGDGSLEIVVGTISGAVYSLRGKDGTPASAVSPMYQASDKILASIVLSRLRPSAKDSVLDIVVASNDGVVHIIDGRGRCRDVVQVRGQIFAAPVIGDVTGAGTVDMVITTMNGHLHAFQSIGTTFEPSLRSYSDHVARYNWFNVAITDREYRDVRGTTMDVRYEIVDRRTLDHAKVKRLSLSPYEVEIEVMSTHGASLTTKVTHPRSGKYSTRVNIPSTKTRGEIRVRVRDSMFFVVDDAVTVSFHEFYDVALKWLVALPFLLASTVIIRYANQDALEREIFGSATIPRFSNGRGMLDGKNA